MKLFQSMKVLVSSALFIVMALSFLTQSAQAQQPGDGWSAFENVSRTPTASTYPAIVADLAGNVHLFWSEDIGGETENYRYLPDGSQELDARGRPINNLINVGNTLYYTRWDGKRWLQPIDIQISKTGRLAFPSAVVDPAGILHVVWTNSVGTDVEIMYSSVAVDEAHDVHAWSAPVLLVDKTLQTYYPAGIACDPAGNIYLLYYQIGVNPGVYTIRSIDGGNTWSLPKPIQYNISETGLEDGSMPVRITADKEGRIHATWTEYDRSGNGKAIYYSQSADQGEKWSTPFKVAAWEAGWYEVDWLSVGTRGDEIHLVWEGGVQAFLNERISYDGGRTWGEGKQILPRLVGENGWSDLVTDSSGELHQLVVKRSGGTNGSMVFGLWYSRWRSNMWEAPLVVGVSNQRIYDDIQRRNADVIEKMLWGTLTGDGLRYQQSTIVNGNELFVVVVNEGDGEIYGSRLLLDAPRIPPVPYPKGVQANLLEKETEIAQPTAVSALREPLQGQVSEPVNIGQLIIIGLIPALLVVLGVFTYFAAVRRA